MHRSMIRLTGFKVLARDGEIGKVEDFYFDDEGWRVRYIVVDTGNWLPGKKVLISVDSFEKPLWDEKKFSVSLTRFQVMESPDIDTKKPVTRQHEAELHKHYGWNPYWTAYGVPTGMGVPVTESSDRRKGMGDRRGISEEIGMAGAARLQSFEDVKGWSINALDGEIGRADDFILDEDSWDIRYLILDTSKWIPMSKKVLVSPNWIEAINIDDKSVSVDLTTDAIKNSPECDPDRFGREYEEQLYRHYGKEAYWSRRMAA